MTTKTLNTEKEKRSRGAEEPRPHPLFPFSPFLLIALLALSAFSAHATSTQIVATVTYTNVIRGVTNGDTITVNGSTRRYTNGTLNSAASWIQSTNIVGWAATNTQVHLANQGATGVEYTRGTNTNSVIIAGSVGNITHTVTLSSGIGTVTYATNVYQDFKSFGGPLSSLLTAVARTNIGSLLMDAIGNEFTTGQVRTISAGAKGLSNYVDVSTAQNLGNKGITNSAATNFVVSGGGLYGITNIAGTNVAITNVTIYLVTISGGNYSGYAVSLTNGTLYSNALHWSRITNAFGLHGTVFKFIDGVYTNAVIDRGRATNFVNYGNAIRSEGAGVNSFQAGSNAVASGNISAASGNDALATGVRSTATGPNAKATNDYASATGADSVAQQYGTATGASTFASTNGTASGVGSYAGPNSFAANGAVALGNAQIAMGGGIEANSPYGIHIGYFTAGDALWNMALGAYANAPYSNSAAIGPRDFQGTAVITTRTNQIVVGTANVQVSIPGTLLAAVTQNLTTTSTNKLNGSISYSSSSISSVAAGHNIIDIGTNTIAYLTGAPGVAWTLGGIIGDIRDNRICTVVNLTGYDCTVWNEDGLVPTAAQRILTMVTVSGTNATLQGNGVLRFIYSSSSARWLLDSDIGDLISTITNSPTANMSQTNGTVMAIYSDALGGTNRFRTVSAGNGLVNTNQGTNIISAIDPSIVASQSDLNTASNVLRTASGGVNGEVSATNANTFGLVYGAVTGTNLLRSISPRNGLTGTNQSGTNIALAIDPAVVASQTDLNAASNAVLSTSVANDTTTSNALRTVTVNGLTNKVDNLNGLATNLTVTGSGTAPGLLLTNLTATGPLLAVYASNNPTPRLMIYSNGAVTMGASTFASSARLTLDGGGLMFGTDNTWDIGASGANRPKDVYAGGTVRGGGGANMNASLFASGGSFVGWTGRSAMSSPSDGVIKFVNNGDTGFNRLQFVGATAASPAIGPTNGDLIVLGGDGSFDGSSTNRLHVPGGITSSNLTITAAVKLFNGSPAAGQVPTFRSDGTIYPSNIVAVGVGTNFPPITTTGTNIVIGTGVRKSFLMPTNASVGISFNGTEILGEQVTLCITNTSGTASNLTISFFQDSAASTYYDGTVASNVSGFLVVSNSSRTLHFTYNGTFWRLDGGSSKEMEPAVSGGLTLSTNSTCDTVTFSTLVATNSYTPVQVTGTGGANTNFTLQAQQPEVIINGFTNVSIVAVMATALGRADYWNLLITNGCGSDRTFQFQTVTNLPRFSGIYGTNAPSVLTNMTQLLISGRSNGTNTLVGYTYFAWP